MSDVAQRASEVLADVYSRNWKIIERLGANTNVSGANKLGGADKTTQLRACAVIHCANLSPVCLHDNEMHFID